MGQSAGAGSPVWFQCSKCRQRKNWRDFADPSNRCGLASRVELTGKTKPHYTARGSAPGIRSNPFSRQYKCLDCGHVGWSTHIDLNSGRARTKETT